MLLNKILLAEDDKDDQFLFADFTKERKDFILLPIAENGVVLMEYLETLTSNELPHLIILDQNMPQMNGLQTLQELKNNNRYAHIPVMLYSTYADSELIRKGTEFGAGAVVSKPATKRGYDDMLYQFMRLL